MRVDIDSANTLIILMIEKLNIYIPIDPRDVITYVLTSHFGGSISTCYTVVRAPAPKAGGPGFDPRWLPYITL